MKVIEKSGQLLFNDFFRIHESVLQIEQFDGSMGKPQRRLAFDRGDAAAVLIREIQTQNFIFVNQFRYPVFRTATDGWITEIIAGIIDGSESPEECIIREAREECRTSLVNIKSLGHFFTSPGGSTEQIHLYYAEAEAGGQLPEYAHGDGSENLKIIPMKITEARKKLAAGYFTDAKTIIALQHYFLHHA
jgi:nudix-type nucleoside diphosphatase (YffH/AdpP family)